MAIIPSTKTKDQLVTEYINRVHNKFITIFGLTYKNDPNSADGGSQKFPSIEGTHPATWSRLSAFQKNAFTLGLASAEQNPTNYIATHPVKGNYISMAGLVELFQAYAYQLTRYKRVKVYDGNEGTSVPEGYAAMGPSYRMLNISFKNAVNALPSKTALTTGKKISDVMINNFLDDLYIIVSNHVSGDTSLIVNSCHSSCHTSCHGSRGRR